MRVIIAGGRNFDNYELLCERCDHYLHRLDKVEIVSGRQMTETEDGRFIGADYLGELYACEKGYPVMPFPARWKSLGSSAGPTRNAEMAAYADALIAFWDGRSRGTANMIEEANKKGIPVRIVRY